MKSAYTKAYGDILLEPSFFIDFSQFIHRMLDDETIVNLMNRGVKVYFTWVNQTFELNGKTYLDLHKELVDFCAKIDI